MSQATPHAWFPLSSTMETHGSTKLYQCLKCGHTTPLFRSICVHLRRHACVACCNICGKDYSTIWEARKHLALAHPNRQPIDFEQVSRTNDPVELLVEVTKQTGDGSETKRQLRGAFRCPLCDFQTWWPSSMHEHLIAASNHQDNVPCDSCGEPVASHHPAAGHGEPTHANLDCFLVNDEDIEDPVCGVRTRIEP